MVHATKQVIPPQHSSLPETEKHMQHSVKSSRSRSTGWTPLVYPASAILTDRRALMGSRNDSSKRNPYFPLHPDVLRAAIRELLTVDGTINGKSLKLNPEQSAFQEISAETHLGVPRRVIGPRYLRHFDPQWAFAPEDVLLETKSKKKRGAHASVIMPQKKRSVKPISDDTDPSVTIEDSDSNSIAMATAEATPVFSFNAEMQSSENLVDTVLRRACLSADARDLMPTPCLSFGEGGKEDSMDGNNAVLPRKVSDADGSDRSNVVSITTFADNYNSAEIACFFDLHGKREEDGSLRIRKDFVVPLLEVSIVSESILKDFTFRMTSQMIESVDEKALRHFLGYKSSSLRSDRLRRLFSEYLFDVSHAMFAWEQTEYEILAESDKGPFSTKEELQKLDATIRDALFDQRALRKLGGFDDSSLLRHALSIRKLRLEGSSWDDFAKSTEGQRLLRHHRDGADSLSVGQKRRGQRVRSRIPVALSDSSDEERRSRASSFASTDEVLRIHADDRKDDAPVAVERVPQPSEMPSIEHLTLRKSMTKSWGVLLAKEGELCVVVRAPDTSEGEGLLFGDMILSVTNGNGDSACPGDTQTEEADWFRAIVNLFKTSAVLHLAVQRVKPSTSRQTLS